MRTRTIIWQPVLITALLFGLFSLTGSQLPQSADAAGAGTPPAATAPRPSTSTSLEQRASTLCANTSCTGVWPGDANCDADVVNIGDRVWAPAVQAFVEFRHSNFCNARWARIYWNYPQTCGLSAISIQQRKLVNGVYKYAATQTTTKNVMAFCEGGKYWTKMVPGQPGQVRMRYAEGYMAAGCVSNCVRWRWYPWSAWRG
jgi:hypothetical protein